MPTGPAADILDEVLDNLNSHPLSEAPCGFPGGRPDVVFIEPSPAPELFEDFCSSFSVKASNMQWIPLPAFLGDYETLQALDLSLDLPRRPGGHPRESRSP